VVLYDAEGILKKKTRCVSRWKHWQGRPRSLWSSSSK